MVVIIVSSRGPIDIDSVAFFLGKGCSVDDTKKPVFQISGGDNGDIAKLARKGIIVVKVED